MDIKRNETMCVSTIWKNDISELHCSCNLAVFVIKEVGGVSSALILLDGHSVDEDLIISSLNSDVALKKHFERDSVSFVICDKLRKEINGWYESSFACHTNKILNNDGESACKTVMMGVVLLPRLQSEGKETDQQRLSASLGHLKVYYESTSATLSSFHLVGTSCLEVDAKCPMSDCSLESIDQHQCFLSTEGSADTTGLESSGSSSTNARLDLSKASPSNEEFMCNTTATSATDNSSNDSSSLAKVYFLQWKLSVINAVDISFYLVFYVDSSGEKHCVGKTVSNCYVFKQAKDASTCPVKFMIQPILNGVGKWLGECFDISIK